MAAGDTAAKVLAALVLINVSWNIQYSKPEGLK